VTGAAHDALVIVGGGHMGAALAAGLLHSVADRRNSRDLVVVESSPERRASLASLVAPARIVAEVPECRDAVIAVKPADVSAVAATLGARGARRIVSVAAGVTTAAVAAAVATPGVEVVRAMPNTPALVGEGATAIAAGAGCGAATLDWARGLLESVGCVVQVDESLMDAVTGVSGSGPAYVYLVAEALIDAAVAEGLAPVDADALVRQLFVGAAALWARDDSSPAALRQRVTSPNGTTAAGVAEMERAGLRIAVARAVRAATARSRELGDTKL
jgi:pyrroline-5-carboxylate reductase